MEWGRRKIIISVTNDLVTDQRIHKVCSTLSDAAYEVMLVGRKLKHSPAVTREYSTHRMRLLFNRSFFFYAEYNIRLFFYLLFSNVDVLLANDTDTLPANYLVSRIRRKPLVFDAHELFPEVPEVVNRRFVKAFWTKIEDWIFPHLKYSYTVCYSIANYYNTRYQMNMQVVRNIPYSSSCIATARPRIESQGKHVLLYQGAVNVGRGIEWIIDAMPYLDDYVFYIAGDGDVMQEMKERVAGNNVQDRVFFLGRLPFEALSEYTACADIGVSLLENRGLSYYYSLPNRIFDFIRHHVPVLATDFPEIRQIIAAYGIGELIDRYDPEYLASAVRGMIAKGKNEDGFIAANKELAWENEAKILLLLIKHTNC